MAPLVWEECSQKTVTPIHGPGGPQGCPWGRAAQARADAGLALSANTRFPSDGCGESLGPESLSRPHPPSPRQVVSLETGGRKGASKESGFPGTLRGGRDGTPSRKHSHRPRPGLQCAATCVLPVLTLCCQRWRTIPGLGQVPCTGPRGGPEVTSGGRRGDLWWLQGTVGHPAAPSLHFQVAASVNLQHLPRGSGKPASAQGSFSP